MTIPSSHPTRRLVLLSAVGAGATASFMLPRGGFSETRPTAGLCSSISAHPMAIIKGKNFDAQNSWILNWEIRTTLAAWVNDFYTGAYEGIHFAGANYLATAYNKGTPIQIVGASASYPWPLLVRADQGINTVKDLKGKTIGIPKTSYIYAYLYAVFQQAGMNLESDTKVGNLDILQAPHLLERGDYDAAPILIEHAITLERDAPGRFKVLLYPHIEVAKLLGRPTMYQFLAMQRPWLDKNRGGAEAILKTFEQVQKFIDQDIEAAAAILAPKTEVSNGRGSGGAALPDFVVKTMYKEGFFGGKMKWYGIPAKDIKTEIWKELELYKQTGLVEEIPNDQFVYGL
jgi:ABC-type nitrate/sulfonate/bicarbonate transport system substrate-binding protein